MAQAIFDAEDLLDLVLEIMQTGSALNNKIAAVELEKFNKSKGLSPTLAPIKDYYCQSWNSKILQKTPSIFYGIEEAPVTNNGPANAVTYKIFVDVVMVDSGQTNDNYKRVFRYSRALKELFEENFAPAILGGHVLVQQIRPVSLLLELDSNEEIKVGGVSLQVSIF